MLIIRSVVKEGRHPGIVVVSSTGRAALHTQHNVMHHVSQAENVPHPGDPAAPEVLGHSRHATINSRHDVATPFEGKNTNKWKSTEILQNVKTFPIYERRLVIVKVDPTIPKSW